MADLRRYVSLAILIGIPFSLIVYNVSNGDQSATTPTSTSHLVYWQLEHTTAIFLKFGAIVTGFILIVAASWKNFRAIGIIGALYLAVGGITVSEYGTNDPDFDYFVEFDIGFFAFPIVLAILRLMGKLRPDASEQEKIEAFNQLRNDAEKDLSQIMKIEAQYWWFKWLSLILVLLGAATSLIGFYLPKIIPSFDPMYSFFAGFGIASAGLIWFTSKRKLKVYRDQSYQ